MGVRLYIGECYGILLTKAERAISFKTVEKRLLPFLQSLYLGGDVDKIMKLDPPDHFIALDMSLKTRFEWYSENEAPVEFLYDRILCPQKEYGSRKFFGYIGSQRQADEMDYCFITLLRHICRIFPTRVQINQGYEFEFVLPHPDMIQSPEDVPKFEIEMATTNEYVPYICREHRKLKRKVWLPNPRIILGNQPLVNALIERGKELKDKAKTYFFDTEDEVKTFLDRHYRERDSWSINYQIAWRLIKLVYSDVPLERIKRYLVGWWA